MGVSANLIVNAKNGVRELRTLLTEGLGLQIDEIKNLDDHSFITLTHRGQQSRLYVARSTEYGGLDATIISTGSRQENIALLRDIGAVLGGILQEADTTQDAEILQEPHNGNSRFILNHQILARALTQNESSEIADLVGLATGYEKHRQDLSSFAPEVYPKFTAKPNPHVSGEVEVYKNGSIFCHLSESDFETFRKMFDSKIEMVA